MITQLNPPIPVSTPKGKGLAHLVIDYGCEHHLIWVCFIDATGECWSFPNPEIRAHSNPTMGRPVQECTQPIPKPFLDKLFAAYNADQLADAPRDPATYENHAAWIDEFDKWREYNGGARGPLESGC